MKTENGVGEIGVIVLTACMTIASASMVQAQTSREGLTKGEQLSGEAVQATNKGDLATGRETATNAFQMAMSAGKVGNSAVRADGRMGEGARVQLHRAAQVEPAQMQNSAPASPSVQAAGKAKKGRGEKIGALAGKIFGGVAGLKLGIVAGVAVGGLVSIGVSPLVGIPAAVVTGAAVTYAGYWTGGKAAGWLGRQLDDIIQN